MAQRNSSAVSIDFGIRRLGAGAPSSPLLVSSIQVPCPLAPCHLLLTLVLIEKEIWPQSFIESQHFRRRGLYFNEPYPFFLLT